MQFALTHREPPRRVRRDRPDQRNRPGLSLIAAGALAALLLAGCGGGASTAGSGNAVGPAPARDNAQVNPAPEANQVPGAAQAPGAKAAPGAASGQADAAKPGTPVVGVAPKLTKSASLDLRVKDISAAAAQVRSIAIGLQALVLSEQIGKGGPGDPQPLQTDNERLGASGTLTLSVPADKLDTALDQLASAKIGTVLRRTTSSQDVTSQYVDTESRLKTMRASVERVRILMAQAKDIGQVVAMESEMSRREADLESLGSQLEALRASVERSTLTVSLSTPANETVKEPVTDNAFLVGLTSGWNAFTTSARGLFIAIGAVLPFAVFLALLGAPLWVWWRRSRTNRPPVVTAPAAPAPAA